MVLAPLSVGMSPATALPLIEGVVASPSLVRQDEPLTISGPAIDNCRSGGVIVTAGGGADEFRFGARTGMTGAWSVTASKFSKLEVLTTFPQGTYKVIIDCNDDRGTQLQYDTTAAFTVVPPAEPDPNAYKAVTPARLMDTRPGQMTIDRQAEGIGPVGPGVALMLNVTGRGGVPETGVKAVVLNITATAPTSGGFLTVFPSGEARPLASNLNFGPGQTVPNLVVAKVGALGQVSIYNDTGSTHVIVDVTGWFPSAAAFTPLTPARLLDTRPGLTVDGVNGAPGPVTLGGVRVVKVTGRAGVPENDVGAVILNVTVTAPSGPGFVTVFPSGESRPLASNLNFVAGQTVANLVVAKVGSGGQVTLYNESPSTHLIADVAGWFPNTSTYRALTPTRLMDTRPGQSTIDGQEAAQGAVGPGGVDVLKVTGRGGVPATGVGAVVLNITATSPTSGGFVTVYPTGESRPLASNLNFAAGQTTPNLVIAKVGEGGQISIYNDTGATHMIADVAGWFSR